METSKLICLVTEYAVNGELYGKSYTLNAAK